MLIDWTKHLKDEGEKKRMLEAVVSSKVVLDRLNQILTEREKVLDHSEIDPKTFETPNWAYLQAFKNGFRAGIAIAKKYTDLDQQKGPPIT